MLKKFQDFAIKGNAFDLAVGVIIGAAFGGIVTSLVGDIFLPIVGAVTGGLDFSNYFVGLTTPDTPDTLAEAKKQGAVLAWGKYLTIVNNFHIVAAVMIGLDTTIQRVRQKEEAKPPAAPTRIGLIWAATRSVPASSTAMFTSVYPARPAARWSGHSSRRPTGTSSSSGSSGSPCRTA